MLFKLFKQSSHVVMLSIFFLRLLRLSAAGCFLRHVLHTFLRDLLESPAGTKPF